MTKEENLNFISYLKSLGDRISIESRMEMHRTMFNHRVFDPYIRDVTRVKAMCLSEASPLQIYEEIAASKAKLNSRWKSIPGFGFVYEEDVSDYLRDSGYNEDEAVKIAKDISLHRFSPKEYKNDARMSEAFRLWGNACTSPLESRTWITRLFPAEYIGFLHQNRVTTDTDFTVTEVSALGTYNPYRYEAMRTNVRGRTHLVVNYDSRELAMVSGNAEALYADGPRITIGLHSLDTHISEEKMIALAKIICRDTGIPEVWLNDLDQEKSITVVKAIPRSVLSERTNDGK